MGCPGTVSHPLRPLSAAAGALIAIAAEEIHRAPGPTDTWPQENPFPINSLAASPTPTHGGAGGG